MKITKSSSASKNLKIILGIIVLLGVAGTALAYFQFYSKSRSNLTSKETTPINSENENPGSISNSRNDTDTSDSSNSSQEPKKDQKPADPTGTFVSNHRPNISGSPSPNTISSTCATNAGMECYIEFKNGNTIKSLSRQKTDSNGNTSWYWSLSDIGITEGTWSVTAIAVNGNSISRSTDPMDMVVAP